MVEHGWNGLKQQGWTGLNFLNWLEHAGDSWKLRALLVMAENG